MVCLYALMRQRWLLAGVAALLAGATAPAGLALVGACAWGAGAALLRRPQTPPVARLGPGALATTELPRTAVARVARPRRDWLALTAPLLAPLGFLAYMAYLWQRTGDITYWYWAERSFWDGRFNPYTSTIGRVIQAWHMPEIPDFLVPTICLFVLAAAAIMLWRWKPPAVVTIYAALVMAFPSVARWRTATPGDYGDSYLYQYLLHWDVHRLFSRSGSVFDANFFWPHRDTLLYSDTVLAVPQPTCGAVGSSVIFATAMGI